VDSGTPIHILIRYSDRLHRVGGVITRHNEVIQSQGSVWFGKLGRQVAQKHIDAVNQQCVSGIPTYLYLVQKAGSGYVVDQGTVTEMARVLPPGKEHLVPEYYFTTGIIDGIRLWARLCEIKSIEPSYLGKLRALSSIMPVPETLARSMSSHFIVREIA